MIKPITPDEIKHEIPDFIIEAVNTLIKEKWDGKKALIKQKDIMSIISSDDEDSDKPSRRTIFDNNWLDFEDIYREVGWNVEYDKPAYNESYDAYFKFTKKIIKYEKSILYFNNFNNFSNFSISLLAVCISRFNH